MLEELESLGAIARPGGIINSLNGLGCVCALRTSGVSSFIMRTSCIC